MADDLKESGRQDERVRQVVLHGTSQALRLRPPEIDDLVAFLETSSP
jgi:hypothetical protein